MVCSFLHILNALAIAFKMKKMKPDNKEELPFNLTLDVDIVSEILARLDVKTLYRLKCVSKEFHCLISDPVFVNTHRLQSMRNIKFLCTTSRVSRDEYSSILSFYSVSRQSHELRKLSSFTLICSHICPITCDLVCFASYQGICLYNPSTREICALPKPATSLSYSRLGFGYSAHVRQYKVVHLFPNSYARGKRSKTEGDAKNKGMQCEIFTLSDNSNISSSSWKPSRCPRRVYPRTISCEGRIYWLIDHKVSLRTLRSTGGTEELILSFDIANDTFSILPRPAGWELETYKKSLVFMVLDGSLCITDKKRMQDTSVLDIWMLKENCFWTKVYSIKLLDYSYDGRTLTPSIIKHMHPICMNGGEIVFKVDRLEHLMEGMFSCIIENRTMSKCANLSGSISIFWESLFRLDSGIKIQPFSWDLIRQYCQYRPASGVPFNKFDYWIRVWTVLPQLFVAENKPKDPPDRNQASLTFKMKKLKLENEDELPFNLKLDADIVSDILARLDVKTLHRLNSILSFDSICGQRHERSKLCSFTLRYDESCPITCDLMCFTIYRGICLCNPSTGELCALPKPSTSLYCTRLGFGYSAQIDDGAPLHRLRTTEELILSFDIANDTFSTLSRPASWPLKSYKDVLLFMVFDQSLCISDKRSMQNTSVLGIWMLKENCSWSKVYNINLLEYNYEGTSKFMNAFFIVSFLVHSRCGGWTTCPQLFCSSKEARRGKIADTEIKVSQSGNEKD
ncbi:OLC1v1032165C2 [Oldenlandia corymbosa var. corymbosa]|uniref:OLC1v1032165C2 n=1 Tax=Oldenlandia corymbosa var. corymbosa TaxID=529605 RepID=A0AAV1CLT9_OLDCO|nr:OLC1v1032165C2 [Oldenlandia corymbosa var. corymbosa]